MSWYLPLLDDLKELFPSLADAGLLYNIFGITQKASADEIREAHEKFETVLEGGWEITWEESAVRARKKRIAKTICKILSDPILKSDYDSSGVVTTSMVEAAVRMEYRGAHESRPEPNKSSGNILQLRISTLERKVQELRLKMVNQEFDIKHIAKERADAHVAIKRLSSLPQDLLLMRTERLAQQRMVESLQEQIKILISDSKTLHGDLRLMQAERSAEQRMMETLREQVKALKPSDECSQREINVSLHFSERPSKIQEVPGCGSPKDSATVNKVSGGKSKGAHRCPKGCGCTFTRSWSLKRHIGRCHK